jgi:hypothetical protein
MSSAIALLSGLLIAALWSMATAPRLLDSQLLVTWYGNPHSARMGILGELSGHDRANGLLRQAAAYRALTAKTVVAAYHLVAVVAQRGAGPDQTCRRRESPDVIRGLLVEARENGFKLILDVQPGRSTVVDELEYLRPFLIEPDVYLALDPEYAMGPGEVPGRERGSMRAADVNAALDLLDGIITANGLPPKVLIVHQFTMDMLPDKKNIRRSANVDLVLNMDGFGSQSLKRSTYRAIMQQQQLDFAGIKLFYRQDTQLFSPEQVLSLSPTPSVIVYQ